jgi:hypothetical protein
MTDAGREPLPKTMRAMVIHQHGGPEVLTLEREWPRPVAGPGEIVVAVRGLREGGDSVVRELVPSATRQSNPHPGPLPLRGKGRLG